MMMLSEARPIDNIEVWQSIMWSKQHFSCETPALCGLITQ